MESRPHPERDDPDAEAWMYLVYLKYYTLNLRHLMVYLKYYSVQTLASKEDGSPAAEPGIA